MSQEVEDKNSQVIAGRNGVLEALRSGRDLDTLYVQKGDKTGSIHTILNLAKTRGLVIKETTAQKLEELTGITSHQGVAAIPCAASYATVEDIFDYAASCGESPFLILCDGIEDPHNLGALIRTAEAAGAHGLVIPKRRAASLTPVVQKTSAGAVNHLRVARVANLPALMEQLKKQGIWIYGADMDGESWCGQDYAGPVALVVGSEGNGISRLVKEKCDVIVSLPMHGKISL